MNDFKYIVDIDNVNLRLDVFICKNNSNISRKFASELIESNNCLVNDKTMKNSYKTKLNDVIILHIPDSKPLDVKKEDIPLNIIFEDDDIIIINKEQGMVVHPSAGHHEHTLVNAILNHCDSLSGINGVLRPGIVHRIDKDTSGLICVAKNDIAHEFLAEQLKDHTMARTYIALVRGVISENSGTIDAPIGRDKGNRQKMAVIKEGKPSITNFKVLKRYANHTLIECSLVTGRTHQIRVHMAYIKHPVEGDPLYLGKDYNTLYDGGQLLTAVKLKLIHPTTKKEINFQVDLPQYFQDILKKLN